MNTDNEARPRFMRFVRRFAVPILVAWLLLTVALNVLVPPIESVARNHAVTMSPQDAPAMIAAKRIGEKFHESDSDSIAMIVLESDKQLGDDAHRYYDGLVKKLQADPKHVQHVQNVWGDPLTAAGVQSRDGKAAYVQLNLAGNQGSTQGNQSVDAVRKIVDNSAPPKGLKVHVTGPAALTTDMNEAADKSMFKMMGVTGVVIMTMLFIAYRLHQHGASGSRHGWLRDGHGQRARRASREQRSAGVFDVRRRHAVLVGDRGGNRLRDLSYRSVSRGSSGRSGSRNRPITACSAEPSTSSWAPG